MISGPYYGARAGWLGNAALVAFSVAFLVVAGYTL